MPTDMISRDALVSFAHDLADASASAIEPFFRSDLAVTVKGGGEHFDPVTEGDRAAEAIIRSEIQKIYPDHTILGEEHGATAGTMPYRWVIDPIDGTRAFILGLPTWGTLIGLEFNGVPMIGLMNQPFTRDRFWSDGQASYFRSGDSPARKISTRSSVTLNNAQMACTHPDMFDAGFEAHAYAAITANAKSCRLGTDCFGYALLAAGLIDLVVEAKLQPYDVVALIPIINNAGGVITTWDGGDAQHGGRIVAAANAKLHAEVLDIINTS
jgi:histidinol phosphatase-like enzyme (inositol monophosphatase family)